MPLPGDPAFAAAWILHSTRLSEAEGAGWVRPAGVTLLTIFSLVASLSPIFHRDCGVRSPKDLTCGSDARRNPSNSPVAWDGMRNAPGFEAPVSRVRLRRAQSLAAAYLDR